MVNMTSWTVCNTTLEDSFIHEDPLWVGHTLTFHHLGLFLCAVFGLIAVVIALYLVFMHATHYLRPYEQRHIIRILLMIPIYAIVSFAGYLFYRKAVYFTVIQGCYEAFAIASFFTLMCHYIAPDLHEQKIYFRGLTPVNWVWSCLGLQKCTGGENKGPFRKPRSGLTWFNIVYVGVFQYCFIRVFFTMVSVITEALGRYCEASLSPAFAHVWTVAFEAFSVTIAMFCLIQFYVQLREDLAEHKPFLKLLCIKLVIFFSFWQTIIISLLSSSSGPLKPSNKISYQDIKVGIPSMLLCIEMACFAVLHLFAFNWKEYSTKHHDPLTMSGAGFSGEAPKYKGGPLGIKALGDALNPYDIIKASARSLRWLVVGYRKRLDDSSYQDGYKVTAGSASEYIGPTFARTGEPATELRAGDGKRRRRDNQSPPAEDDHESLLRHSARMGRQSEALYHTTNEEDGLSGEDSQLDLGAPPQQHSDIVGGIAPDMPHAGAYMGSSGGGAGGGNGPPPAFDADTAYHSGVGPTSRHPAYRRNDDYAIRQWDRLASSRGEDKDDEDDEDDGEVGDKHRPFPEKI